MLRNRDIVIDLLKFVGNTVRDSVDVRTYRITVMIEDNIDDNNSVLLEHITVDKKLSILQLKIIIKEIRALFNKK